MNDYKELVGDIGDCLVAHPSETLCKRILREAADAIEQLAKERDAAVANLKNNGDCSFCKHEQVPIDNEPCNSCMYDGYESNFSNFEWRGVQEDNDEID